MARNPFFCVAKNKRVGILEAERSTGKEGRIPVEIHSISSACLAQCWFGPQAGYFSNPLSGSSYC